MAAGVHFGPKFKLSPFQRAEALKRRAVGEESLTKIGASYGVSAATISRLA